MYKTTPGFASAPSQVFKGSTSAVTHQVFKIISMQIQIHYAACLASDNIRAKLCHLQLRSKFSSTILLSINLSFSTMVGKCLNNAQGLTGSVKLQFLLYYFCRCGRDFVLLMKDLVLKD